MLPRAPIDTAKPGVHRSGGIGGDVTGGSGDESLSCRNRTTSAPPTPLYPWLVSVRTSRYLLGPVGVHWVVVPSSGNVFASP